MLRQLGGIQLDTISVLARSHELVPYARLGPVGREAVEAALWHDHRAVEYWAHAACVIPLELWPSFTFKRRSYAQREVTPEVRAASRVVLRRLEAEGPLTATELGGARRGGPWWDWSDTKRAAEWLLSSGRIVCVERRGWRRVYDLPDRVIPPDLRRDEPDDETCIRTLLARAGRGLGVGTLADLADYFRIRPTAAAPIVDQTGLVEVEVQGWRQRAWADAEALGQLGERGRHRTTLLSPFDSLVWYRPRAERLFGFVHRLEAYVPSPRRVHGYFAMPLLSGGDLVGRIDPARRGRTLVALRSTFEPHAVTPARAARTVAAAVTALREAAAWVGCDTIAVEAVEPTVLAGPLREATRG